MGGLPGLNSADQREAKAVPRGGFFFVEAQVLLPRYASWPIFINQWLIVKMGSMHVRGAYILLVNHRIGARGE